MLSKVIILFLYYDSYYSRFYICFYIFIHWWTIKTILKSSFKKLHTFRMQGFLISRNHWLLFKIAHFGYEMIKGYDALFSSMENSQQERFTQWAAVFTRSAIVDKLEDFLVKVKKTKHFQPDILLIEKCSCWIPQMGRKGAGWRCSMSDFSLLKQGVT